jgi:hypothetical protein
MNLYNPSMNSNGDPLVNASEEPNILALHDELQRCFYHGANAAELSANDDLRYCRWDGQSVDGRKHSTGKPEDEPAMPFEGASDVRIRLIDRVINEQVAMLMNSLKLAKLGVSGRTADDAAYASGMTALIGHITNRLRTEMRRETELLCQYGNQYGWSAMYVGWEQQVGLREQKTNMVEVLQMASTENGAGELIQMLPEYILNPQTEDMAVGILKQKLSTIKEADIRKMVKDLREFGVSTTFEETITKNLPCVTALKPFDEISFPPETIEFQKARVVFRRMFMNEVELRSMERNEGWDSKAIDEAVNTAGKMSWYNDPNIVPRANMLDTYEFRGNHLIEVCYAYTRQINSDGVPHIYYTAFCPNASSQTYFKHEKLGYAHGNYPFVIYRRENIRKNIAESRGIPEILMTEQAELKGQHDSMRDRTAFETVPPIMVKRRIQGIGRIGPAQQLPVSSPDDYRFMDPPKGTPNLAQMVIQQVESNAGRYFGLTSGMQDPTVPAPYAQMLQQVATDNWLTTISEVYTQLLQLSLQYLAAEEIERITNISIPQNMSDIANQFDYELKFDIRNLYVDFVMEKLTAINQSILPMDVGGVIDRNKLIAIAMNAIAPDMAKEVIIDQATASQKMFKEVQTDIALMILGNEAQYVENDPTAQTKMQYVQDIMSKNPVAQQAAQTNPTFQMIFQNYIKNLQMSVSQQQNKQIGRIGVSPLADKLAQESIMPPTSNETSV